jgi:hypothetical protein
VLGEAPAETPNVAFSEANRHASKGKRGCHEDTTCLKMQHHVQGCLVKTSLGVVELRVQQLKPLQQLAAFSFCLLLGGFQKLAR